MKISFRKSLKLIALLITSLLIATVSAAAYVTLQWTNTATVAANPKVCFFAWSAPTTKLNTFDYAVNIFPSVKTIDENITHGVWNWDTASHVTSMRWYSLTNSSNIASLNVTVYNSTTTIYSQYWSSVSTLPTGFVQFSPSPMANGKYRIWMEIKATSGATPGQKSVFTFEMKVESP
jgi:hypothetical protein